MGKIFVHLRNAFIFLFFSLALHLLYYFHLNAHTNVYIRFYRHVRSFDVALKASEEIPGPPVPSSTGTELYSAVNDSLSRELYTKVRVLCWVMTGPQYHWSKARHVKQTWGRRCNIIVFISSEEDDRIPTIKVPSIEGYETLWGKTREAFRYVWEHYRDQADWFLKADDDSYVIVENLRYFLSPFNTSEPLYFGHKYRAYVKSGYMQGGSGYVLSKEGLRRFVEIGLNDPAKCSQIEGPEDVEMGQCMENLDIRAMDSRDAYGRDRFLPLPLEYHLTLGILTESSFSWYGHPSFYPVQMKFDCCSDSVIGFHKVNPSVMYTYEYLIYHVQPYGVDFIRSHIQSTPNPSPDAKLEAKSFEPSREELKRTKFLRRKNRMMEARFNKADIDGELEDSNDSNERTKDHLLPNPSTSKSMSV